MAASRSNRIQIRIWIRFSAESCKFHISPKLIMCRIY
jgi:hypothetical protein